MIVNGEKRTHAWTAPDVRTGITSSHSRVNSESTASREYDSWEGDPRRNELLMTSDMDGD